jgi:RNA polymerase sigma-70 factor, ECF subfamily
MLWMAQETPVHTGNQTITETQLVARLKQGDLSGLEWLVQRYQVQAVHAALLVVHDRELAEEIVQNSFYQAVLKIDQFDLHRPFGPWFIKSVVNAALQEAQRQKQVLALEEDAALDQEETRAVAAWLIDPERCPEDLVETRDLYQAVWQALDQLPPTQRAAIVMRYFQDSSEADLTQIFQRPLTTVKWWLHAARGQLRRILQREYSGIDDQEAPHE